MNHTKIEELISCKLSSDLHTCGGYACTHMYVNTYEEHVCTQTHSLDNIERKYLSKEKKEKKLRTLDVLGSAAAY